MVFLSAMPLFTGYAPQAFIPLFSRIVIKVGKPLQPPQSSSRDDLNNVTMQLQDVINNLIG